MNSSWKRRAFNLFAAAALAAAALFPNLPASASGCPTTPVDEQGGKHWCYNHDSSKGHVHLWTPPGFKADGAVTAVYIHGHDLSGDPCPSVHYIDCAWDAHKLATQFRASGINALFVAVEGATSPSDSKKWSSLTSLLSSIKDKGGLTPPEVVTVLGHSAGMYTAKSLWGDARVKHLVTVDWLQGKEKPPLYESVASWYKGASDRKLTILSGSTNQTAVGDELAKLLSCPSVSGTPALTADQIDGRCLHIKAGGGHMEVVTQGKGIPLALTRSGTGPTSGAATTAPATGGGRTITSTPLQDATISGPTLEIPIPNVEFSDAIRQSGQVTIPWLAQYVGGIYTFLLSIAGMLAAVMMVVGGFQYVTSGGDQGKIGAGKKRIVNALTGLVLALASYVILYSINPELVAFDGLKFSGINTIVIDGLNTDFGDRVDPDTVSPDSGQSVVGSFPLPHALVSAAKADEYCPDDFPEPAGIAKDGDVVKIPTNIPGIIVKAGDPRVRPFIVNGGENSPLGKVGAEALRKGRKIIIGSAFRIFEEQEKLWCGVCKSNHPDYKERAKWCAVPGGSKHGAGVAIDVRLATPGGEGLTPIGSAGQASADAKLVEELADIFYTVPGWNRLGTEIWHFEYGTEGTDCRGKYYTKSDSCDGKKK